jgi:hypothetical protein
VLDQQEEGDASPGGDGPNFALADLFDDLDQLVELVALAAISRGRGCLSGGCRSRALLLREPPSC